MKHSLSATVVALSLVACGDNHEDHSEELAALQAMFDDLQNEYAALETQLEQMSQERDELAGKLTSLEGRTTPKVTLEVPLKYGAANLALGTAYPIGGGATISFREVRYWLTNVSLQKANDEWVAVPDAYYLIEARGDQLLNGTQAETTLAAKRRETVTLEGVPAGDYKSIKFNIGVDAAHNNDLSMPGGELHTLRNMTVYAWMWHTSYVFTKTVADISGGDELPEVAWDNGTNADLREVMLPFPSSTTMAAGKQYAIKVNADMESLVADVDPSVRGTIGSTTPDARTVLADAFRDMFTMSSVSTVQ